MRSSATYVRKVLREVNEEPDAVKARRLHIDSKRVDITAEGRGAVAAAVDEHLDAVAHRAVDVLRGHKQQTISVATIKGALGTMWGDDMLDPMLEVGAKAQQSYEASLSS